MFLIERMPYWKLEDEELGVSLCRTRFGKGYGHAARQNVV